jgi:uncharacterized membrane protein
VSRVADRRCRVGPSRSQAQAGQAILWVVVMLPLFLSVIGLTMDGGIVFGARRELQNVADSAARAGAMQVDQEAYRASSGSSIVLDVEAAQQVAAEYVAGQSRHVSATIEAEPRRVMVRASREVPTGFLRLVGINTVRITATAHADVRYGIERGNQ